MSVIFKFDSSGFQRDLRRCAALSKRKLPEFINRKMRIIAMDAYQNTPKADKQQIETELGAKSTFRLSKKGNWRKRYDYQPTKMVYKVVNATQAKRGQPPLRGEQMESAARKLVQGRIRAVGSLRSGWVGALRTLSRVLGLPTKIQGSRPVKQAGKARPAKEGFNPVVTAEYNLNVKREGAQTVDPRVTESVGSAFAKEGASMKKHLDREMQAVVDSI